MRRIGATNLKPPIRSKSRSAKLEDARRARDAERDFAFYEANPDWPASQAPLSNRYATYEKRHDEGRER